MHGCMGREIRLGPGARWTLLVLTATAALMLAPAAAQACKGTGAAPKKLNIKQARATVACLVNERRRARGLRPLRVHVRLGRAAQRHSKSMDVRNFFSHYGPGGSSPDSRIRSAGYMSGASSWGVGENIQWGRGGRGSPKAAVRAWMKSPSHRALMLSRSYKHIGIGLVVGSPTGGGERNSGIYTATFGYRS
jgi:uncharacterized protein YkwD